MLMRLLLVGVLVTTLPFESWCFRSQTRNLARKNRNSIQLIKLHGFSSPTKRTAPLNIRGGSVGGPGDTGGGSGGSSSGDHDGSSRSTSLCLLPHCGIALDTAKLKSIGATARLMLSLGFWWYVIRCRPSLMTLLRNIVAWSCWASIARLTIGLTLQRYVAILHVYEPSLAPKNATENCPTSTNKSVEPLYGLNVPMQKFRIWAGFHLGDVNCIQDDEIKSFVCFARRKAFGRKRMEVWRKGRLFVGPAQVVKNPKEALTNVCGLYACVLDDELSDDRNHSQLMSFLHTEYGSNITHLEAPNWRRESDDRKLEIMQDFLDWFRIKFPYYYDKCSACGASSHSSEDVAHRSYLGDTSPSDEEELVGKTKHVEFYHCPNCGSVTRFPRFNAAMPILKDGRGRCGEYNLLLLRMLQALGHSCRYVVDVKHGHIWSEIQWASSNTTRSDWLHLDPCEAAANKNLLYQEWGRHMTSVFAVAAPPFVSGKDEASIPIIEDVTDKYTSKKVRFPWRQKTIDEVSDTLRQKIAKLQKEKAAAESPLLHTGN